MTSLSLHKRFVNSLKLTSILGIIAILSLFYYSFIYIKPPLPSHQEMSKKTVIPAPSALRQDYEITIQNSIFKGLNKDQEPYTIHAHRAYKITDDQYELDQINAEYKFKNEDLLIKATKGLINDDVKFLKLEDNVQLTFDDLIFRSNQMEVNLVNKQATSNSPIELFYKHSTINADSFTSKENNHTLNFKGHVRTKINLSDF